MYQCHRASEQGLAGCMELGPLSCSPTACLTCQHRYHSPLSNVFLTCGLIRQQKVSVTLHLIPLGCCSHLCLIGVGVNCQRSPYTGIAMDKPLHLGVKNQKTKDLVAMIYRKFICPLSEIQSLWKVCMISVAVWVLSARFFSHRNVGTTSITGRTFLIVDTKRKNTLQPFCR